jgi:hypothetical protein
METVRSKKIVAKLDELEFGFWEDDGDVFVTDKEAVKAHLNLSDEAYDSISMFVSDIKALVGKDLQDIWERLEILDEKVFG